MTRIITADSASSRSARSSEKSPAVIQLKSVWLIWRLSGGMPASASTCITAIDERHRHHRGGEAAGDRLRQALPDERVDEEAAERK